MPLLSLRVQIICYLYHGGNRSQRGEHTCSGSGGGGRYGGVLGGGQRHGDVYFASVLWLYRGGRAGMVSFTPGALNLWALFGHIIECHKQTKILLPRGEINQHGCSRLTNNHVIY